MAEARGADGIARCARVADAVQRHIERFYRIEEAPTVVDFLREPDAEERETVRVLEGEDGAVEIAVVAPALASRPDLDGYCQIIEGVSHFVYLAERARTNLPATQLELELQAEIDKWVVLVLLRDPLDATRARAVHARLYERVRFAHPAGTVEGDRYRLANDLAARLVKRFERTYVAKGRLGELRDALARFWRMGQGDKIGWARAA